MFRYLPVEILSEYILIDKLLDDYLLGVLVKPADAAAGLFIEELVEFLTGGLNGRFISHIAIECENNKLNSIIKLIKKSIMQYTNNNQYPYMYSDGSEEEGDSDG